MAAVCPQCGSAIPAQAAFCPGCAMALPGRLCSRCGAVLAEGARFCHVCSHPVPEPPQPAGASPATDPAPPASPPAPAPAVAAGPPAAHWECPSCGHPEPVTIGSRCALCGWAATGSAAAGPATRKCPMCAEQIPTASLVCLYCRARFDRPPA